MNGTGRQATSAGGYCKMFTRRARGGPYGDGVDPSIAHPLVRACQAGDAAAFETLFERHRDRVYSLALYVLRNEEAAADVTQEVFLKLLTGIGSFRGEAKFETWLYRLAMNTAVDALRARRPTVPIDAETCEELASCDSPEADYERRVVADEVRGALDRLSPKLRAAVVSRYVLELDYDEIADALGVSPGTVASRLSRARAALAGQLGRLRAWGAP